MRWSELQPWLRAVAFAALVALAAGAVLSVPYVATHDGPNHLANCVLGHRLQDPTSWLHRYVELGAPITGQGFQVLCGPLVGWMDPFTAYALTLAIAVVLFGVAASVLALSLHRDSPVWAFGFAVALGWVFYMGFLPFHIASSLGLLAVALAVSLDLERGLGYLGLALVLLTTAYAHVLPAVEAGAVVLLVVVARAETGRRMQALLRVALAGLPAALLASSMLWVYLTRPTLAGVAMGNELMPYVRAPLHDLASTFAGGPPLRAYGLLSIPVLGLAWGLRSVRRMSRVQVVLLVCGGLGLVLAALGPFHLNRWAFFAPRFSLMALILLVAGAPVPPVRVRRWIEVATVGVAVASLSYAAAYNRRIFDALGPDLAGLELPIQRAGIRLPMMLDAVASDFEHAEPGVQLGHLYVVRQGGIDPFVWADSPTLDLLNFTDDVDRLFGRLPPRYPRYDLLMAGQEGRPPREAALEVFTLVGRGYVDVILMGGEPDVLAHYLWRGYRLEAEAGRVRILSFAGCPVQVDLRGPEVLTRGLVVQAGLPGFVDPMSEVELPAGAALADHPSVTLPSVLCGKAWIRIRSGPEGSAEALTCAEVGVERFGLELRPGAGPVVCTLAPVGPSALPRDDHQ
ncbi:MAG: hypothetical protein H6730_09935 [Deltaproteobacteria bacterium]|nr:hypothetical protein [Deltaproteobacteria bacterium]